MRIAGAGWGRCIWFVEAVWVSPVPRYQSRTNSEGSVIPSIYLGKFHHDRTLFSRAESWLREIIPIHGSSMQVCEILVHLPRYYPDITQILPRYMFNMKHPETIVAMVRISTSNHGSRSHGPGVESTVGAPGSHSLAEKNIWPTDGHCLGEKTPSSSRLREEKLWWLPN